MCQRHGLGGREIQRANRRALHAAVLGVADGRPALKGVLDWHAVGLHVCLQALPVVEIDSGQLVVLDQDGVVGLRAEAGLRPVGAAAEHRLRDTALDIDGELVVADVAAVVEQPILDVGGRGRVQAGARVVILGVPDVGPPGLGGRRRLGREVLRPGGREDHMRLAGRCQLRQPGDQLRVVQFVEPKVELAAVLLRAVDETQQKPEDVGRQEFPYAVARLRNVLLQGRQEPFADVGGGSGRDALRLRLLHVFELLQQVLRREDAVGVRRLHASAARVGVRDVDRRRLDRIGEQRQRPRSAPVARLAIAVPVDGRARLGNGLAAWTRQAHRHDLVVHFEVDGSHARTVTRPPECQVAPLVRLDRPDRAVLVEPIRVRLVAERNPGGKDAPPARRRTGLAHARDHEAEAVGDRAVRLPPQIGHFAVAPGVGLYDLAHRDPIFPLWQDYGRFVTDAQETACEPGDAPAILRQAK